MCDICKEILPFFHSHDDRMEAYNDYQSAYRVLRRMCINNEMEFVAGDCPLEDIEKHIELEDLYTISHYFRCKCGKIFFVGFCCRGMPICTIEDSILTDKHYWNGRKFGSWKFK